jgi:hypothetical protein
MLRCLSALSGCILNPARRYAAAMKAILKTVLILLGLLIAIVAGLYISRASEKVVVTNKPSTELNTLNLELAGVSAADPAAWQNFAKIVQEPSELWRATRDAAGGAEAQPADWPEKFVWPYDSMDAKRPGAPQVVKDAAARAIETLRANGFFDRLAAARKGPVPVFQVPFKPNESLLFVLLPELGAVRNTARHESLRMKLALERGDEQDFLEAVRDNFFIAKASSQCFLIGTLVNYAVNALNFAEIRHALREHTLSPATLVALDEMLLEIKPRPAMRHALRAERASQQDMVQRFYSDDGEGNGHFSNKAATSDMGLADGGLPGGTLATFASFVMADRKETEKAFDTLRDDTIAQLERASIPEIDATLDTFVTKYEKRRYPFVHILAPALGTAIITAFSIETDLNATRITIALERHRQANGSFPESLDALAPGFMKELPKDGISGKAWGYRVLPTPDEHGRRYLLYSIGADRTDDGGVHGEEARKMNAKSKGKDYLYTQARE